MTHREIIDGWHPFTPEEIDRYVAGGFWRNWTLCDLLERNANIFPDRVAFADDTKAVTWKALYEKSNRMAVHLKKIGVRYGDFFVLQMVNVIEFFYLFFGLNRIGAIPIMCLPRHRKLEVNHEIGLHRARGICVMGAERFDYVQMVEQMKDSHPYLEVFIVAGEKPAQGWLSLDALLEQAVETEVPADYLDDVKPDPNDICCEQLSGGTTGLPKGIPRTHNDYICQFEGYARLAGYTQESVALIVIPVEHNASFTGMTGPALFMGATVVMTKSPRPLESYELIQKYGVTHTLLIPVQVTYWQDARELRETYDLSSLRVMGVAAQKVKPELAEFCMTELGVNLVNHFGMAEGPLICNRWDSPKEPQLHTVGYPMYIDPLVQIKIFNDKNEEVPQGEIGEMVAKGFLNLKGYFRNPEENEKAFDEKGFFHSGDLMSQRPDGRFVVEGRKKDMIIRGGENVYPEAVEDLLVRHPKVMYVAVVGMPDDKLGEKLCAFIQPVEGQTISFEEVQQFMEEQGSAIFQWPERLEILDGWPLTGVNKIDKRRLRVLITVKLFQEGAIDKTFGDEYLKREKICIDDVISGKEEIKLTKMQGGTHAG
ncbi:MAG: AMP-binding protein [Desulfobacterales bacterium]